MSYIMIFNKQHQTQDAATGSTVTFIFKNLQNILLLNISQSLNNNHLKALWILPGTTRVSRYQKKTFTHSHLLWLSIIPYLLPPSVTIHGILCLTVFFHNLSPSFLWSTSWPGTLHFILHTFLHPIIVFLLSYCSTCTYHCNLFCCSTKSMSSNPNLSLNPLLKTDLVA